MPDSVYMHKDAKYGTLGFHTVYEEFELLSENDYNEKVLDDYVEYTPMYRLEESVRHTKEQMIEKACEWLEDQAAYYSHWEYNGDTYEKEIVVDTDKMIEQFKNYMQDESN